MHNLGVDAVDRPAVDTNSLDEVNHPYSGTSARAYSSAFWRSRRWVVCVRRIGERRDEQIRRQEPIVDEQRVLDEQLQVVRQGSDQVPAEQPSLPHENLDVLPIP